MDEPSPRVIAEWRNRVAAEYRSSALTAALVHRAILAGFPEPLLHTGLRIVRDELDHASLSHTCLIQLGGGNQPVELHVDTLSNPTPDNLLASLVDTVVRDFCLGETLAVPLFAAMRRGTTHPAVLPVMTRVLADEAIHRQFGWDALDELLARDGGGVRSYVGDKLPVWLHAMRDAYAAEGDGEPLTDTERAVGLIDRAEYRAVFWDTIDHDLARRFGSREISFVAPERPRG